MRKFSLPFALAFALVAAVAIADPDKKVAQFDQLSASGVSGEARLNPMPQGGTKIQAQLQGLVPNTEYVSVIFANGTCTGGGEILEVTTFTANPAGKAVYNQRVDQELIEIHSVSVQLASDLTVFVACANTE